MAGSRLQKFGTVFTRVRDLIRAGVVKRSDKPIWYDVFKTFPPLKDPLFAKQESRPLAKRKDPVPAIFYTEDNIRAKFYEVYGTGPRIFDLSKSTHVSTCERFVETYRMLETCSGLDGSALFEETAKVLLADGIVLRGRGIPMVSLESRDPLLELKLTDMLAEQQSIQGSAK